MATTRQRTVKSAARIGGWKTPDCFRSFIALCFVATVFIATNRGEAGARRFTYVYEATTSSPGTREFENWITWGTSPREDRRFNEVDFRNEIEFGVTEHFQIALYLADWGYREDPSADEHGFSYQDSAIELIYNLTNPTTDLLGLRSMARSAAARRSWNSNRR